MKPAMEIWSDMTSAKSTNSILAHPPCATTESTPPVAKPKIWIDLDTNAESGAGVFIASLNGGLKSTRLSSTITSATADLASASSGYGAQGLSVTQGSGGPLALSSPYNGAGQNVGILNATIRQLLSATAPITAGRASIQIKVKASSTTPSSSDYGDTLTITTAGIF